MPAVAVSENSLVVVLGPRDAGPGERAQMLEKADEVLRKFGVDDITRIDVPGRGAGEDSEDSALRIPIQNAVPAFQSGSLFGERTGVLVVDAQQLQKAEATVIAELCAKPDDGSVVVVFVSAGAVPAPLGSFLKKAATSLTVKKLRERDAADWLHQAARDRGVRVTRGAVDALVQRFGSNIAAMGQALDQLAVGHKEISEDVVAGRFKNRPDEPMWYYADAVAAGDHGEALRRLADFLIYGHPLQLLAFVENDLKRRSMAAAAPDQATFAEWIGQKSDAYPVKKAWQRRMHVKSSDLALALNAVARADLTIKTQPEVTHRVTLERLTVALSRWYGGSRR